MSKVSFWSVTLYGYRTILISGRITGSRNSLGLGRTVMRYVQYKILYAKKLEELQELFSK